MDTKKYVTFLLVLMAFLLTSGCSHILQSASPQQMLKARVDQLWQARMAKDNETVYEIADSKYRETVSQKDFLKKSGMNVLTYEITEIVMDGPTALVKAVFETQKLGITMRLNLNELWLLEAGQWHLNLSEMLKKGPFGGAWGKK